LQLHAAVLATAAARALGDTAAEHQWRSAAHALRQRCQAFDMAAAEVDAVLGAAN
jgi:hypothetical protein